MQLELFENDSTQKIINNDCLAEMKKMEDNSIDFIVTDPPYGLSFMNKDWDKETPGQEIWQEALRICKPGSMLAAFGGSRTHHHLMIALERAGWEIRDVIMWVYGSGFPKSHNFGNKLGGDWKGYGTALKPSHEIVICAQKPLSISMEQGTIVESLIKLWCQLCLMLPVNVAEQIFMSNNLDMKEVLDFAQWTAEKKSNIQEDLFALMDMSQLEKVLISCLNIVSSWKTILEDHWKDGNTSIISMKTNPIIDLKILKFCLSQLTLQSIIQVETNQLGSWLIALPVASYLNAVCESIKDINIVFAQENVLREAAINCPHETGLTLSPNYEPIIIAMKPLDGTFANNAEKWGVAGINIDSSRIQTDEDLTRDCLGLSSAVNEGYKRPYHENAEKTVYGSTTGRWPANIIFDEDAAHQLDQMTSFSKSTDYKNHNQTQSRDIYSWSNCKSKYIRSCGHNDSGGASRFFYCAKASTAERNKGLDGMPLGKPVGTGRSKPDIGRKDPKSYLRYNHHPTVKPIALMKYIITLLAPPVRPLLLDPFAGSGSTLLAAKELNIDAIGIEINKEYCEIAERRLKNK